MCVGSPNRRHAYAVNRVYWPTRALFYHHPLASCALLFVRFIAGADGDVILIKQIEVTYCLLLCADVSRDPSKRSERGSLTSFRIVFVTQKVSACFLNDVLKRPVIRVLAI